MKKALVISSFPAPYRVGVFKELSKKYDLKVFFATNENDNRNSEWFCKPGELNFQVLNNPQAVSDFDQELKSIKKFDFVLAYDPTEAPAIKAISVCRLHGVKYFVNCDGAVIRRNIFKDAVKRFLYKGAAGCFSSGRSADEYFMAYGVKPQNIYRHKFSSLYERDLLARPVDADEKKQIRISLNLSDKFTFISVGQFIPRKGFDVLLKAWKDVASDAQLVIIGGGEERKLYEDMIASLPLHNVILLDFMDKNRLSQYYKASDVFVLATREDIWGLVVGEAMAHGLPVITTDKCVAGVEMISEGKNGFLVQAENAEELSEKINYMCHHPNDSSVMADANIRAIKEYTIEKIAQSHIEVIDSCLEN